MRILLVESEPATAQSIELMLKSEGFNVYTTDEAEEAIELGRLYDYDGIVLSDVFNAHAVLHALRLHKVKSAILRLSTSHGVEPAVLALNAGADDYLTKPFHKDELVARIHAVVRRATGHVSSVITTGNLSVNISERTVTVDGNAVRFTGKEYAMLELLSLRKGMTLPKEAFLNHLYGGMDEPEIKIIDVFICKIRKKLAAAGGHPIETVWGRGYVLRDPPALLPKSPSLAPEVRDMVDDPPTGFVPERTFTDRRNADIAQGRIKSPSIVPGGQ